VTDEPARTLRRALLLGGACMTLLVTVYVLAVRTVPGQRFEDAVLRAADLISGSAQEEQALVILDPISIRLVVAAAILVMLIAVRRRKVILGLLSVGMIGASIITTELFQRFAQRPILLEHGLRREDQSFPSGHTAVAMSLMCALVMVAPYRFRGLAVFLTSLGAAGVGVATVTASWHRPSDTIGADLIVVGYACAAVAVMARWGRVREAALPTPRRRALRGLLAGAYAAIAAIAFVVAAIIVVGVLNAGDHSSTGAAMLLAGRSLALSGSAAVAMTLLALLRHVDLGAPPADRADEGSPDVEPGHAGIHRSSGP
jgi:membrane-associated phospholipid phosphatase